jgi:hypothetical protein
MGRATPFDFIGDPTVNERKNLKSTTIGQDWAIPAHEAVQPSMTGDQLVTRLEVEMIGVAKNDRCPMIA